MNMKRNNVYASILLVCTLLSISVLSGCQRTEQQTQETTVLADGMLMSYDGENAELTIPDDIVKIDADAFQAIPSPGQVTHITLGGNTEEISPTAFDSFTALRGVTVPAGNEFFRSFTDESWDCAYLCGTDTPIVFCFPGNGSSIHLSGDADAPYFYGEHVSVDFICNGAVFTISAEKDGDDVMRWYCSSMRSGENMLVFEAPAEFQGGNYQGSILRTSSGDIVFQRQTGVSADAYILTASGEHVELYSWRSGEDGISFRLGAGGELRYEKVAAKYADFEQYAACPAGVDGNAIYSEEGTASVVAGELVLTADKQRTVSDYWSTRES